MQRPCIVVLIVSLCAASFGAPPATAEPYEYFEPQRRYGGLDAGAEAYDYFEAKRRADIAVQSRLNDDMLWFSTRPFYGWGPWPDYADASGWSDEQDWSDGWDDGSPASLEDEGAPAEREMRVEELPAPRDVKKAVQPLQNDAPKEDDGAREF